MSGKDIFGIISVIFGITGLGVYIWSIFRRQTKPHIFSWLIWGILTAIAFCAQVSTSAGPGAWVTAVTSIMCFIISVLGYFRGEKEITVSDKIAFVSSLAAIPLWLTTKNPLYAVFVVTLVEAFAFYPTFRKSYTKPREEFAFTYGLDALKYVISILAMENYSVTSVLYPAFVILLNSLFVVMVMWRRHQLHEAY